MIELDEYQFILRLIFFIEDITVVEEVHVFLRIVLFYDAK